MHDYANIGILEINIGMRLRLRDAEGGELGRLAARLAQPRQSHRVRYAVQGSGDRQLFRYAAFLLLHRLCYRNLLKGDCRREEAALGLLGEPRLPIMSSAGDVLLLEEEQKVWPRGRIEWPTRLRADRTAWR